MSNDWPPETSPEDYFRNRQKEAMHEARRPSPQNPAALLGPGMSARAVEVLDWNDEVATFNGFFHSAPGAYNAPVVLSDPANPASAPLNIPWTGQTIARADGSGMQQVWATDDPVQMHYRVRNFHVNVVDPGAPPVFEDWRKYATPSGAIPYEDIIGAPDPSGSDGVPPATAPSLVYLGNVGSLFWRWNAVTNADPVTYRLHVRATVTSNPDGTPNGVTPLNPTTDGTYEVAAGVGLTFASVKALRDGTAVLNDGLTTYVGIVSVEDEDTPNATSRLGSTPVAAVPTPLGPADMLVRAELLLADKAFIDALNATDFTAVTMTGPIIQTDPDPNKGIHIDKDGLRAYGPNGGAPFLNVDPVQGVVIVAGSGTFSTLTVTGGAELAGVTGITPGSRVVLEAGPTAPTSPPVVSSAYIATPTTAAPTGTWADRASVDKDHLGWGFVTFNNALKRLERYDTTTGVPVLALASSTILQQNATAATLGRICWAESIGKYFVLFRDKDVDGVDIFVLARYSTAFVREAAVYTITSAAGLNTASKTPAIGWDATAGQVIAAQAQAGTGNIRICRYNFTSTYSAGAVLNTTANYNDHLATVAFASGGSGQTPWDLPIGTGDRYLWTNLTTGAVFVYSVVGATESGGDTWDSPASAKLGVWWDGISWRSLLTASGSIVTFTGYAKTTPISSASTLTKWYTQTYLRAGVGETTQSPAAKVVTKKRQRISITGAALPASPGPNDPNQLQFYTAQGTTDPSGVRTNMNQTGGGPAAGASTYAWNTWTFLTGTPPPGASSFPDSIPADVEATNGGFRVDGQSNGSVGTGTFRDSVAAIHAPLQVVLGTQADATGTGNVTLSGFSITFASPNTSAWFEVTIAADVSVDVGVTNILELLVDGTAQTTQIITALTAISGGGNARIAGSKTWLLTGLATGNHTLTARTRNTSAASTGSVRATHTRMFVKRIG